MKRRKNPPRKTDADRVKAIRAAYNKAELHPWRAYKSSYGWDVVEPKSLWGIDTLIAKGLDGDTAALLSRVPDDMRFLLRLAELALKVKVR